MFVPLADQVGGALVQVSSAWNATDPDHILHQVPLMVSVVAQSY